MVSKSSYINLNTFMLIQQYLPCLVFIDSRFSRNYKLNFITCLENIPLANHILMLNVIQSRLR